MDKQEFIDYVKSAGAVSHDWLSHAKSFRRKADEMDEHDPILSTMMRRLALSIEQWTQRVHAHIHNDKLDRLIQEEDEVDKLVSDLFTQLTNPKPAKLSFDELSAKVDLLYQMQIDGDNLKEVEKHCTDISDIIKRAGWDENEYWNQWIERQEKDFPGA